MNNLPSASTVTTEREPGPSSSTGATAASHHIDAAIMRRRGLTKRQILYRFHLWLGVALGLYFVMIGLTGSLLVFGRELDLYLNADLLRTTPRGPLLPASTIMESFHRAYPHAPVATLNYPRTRDGVYWIKVGPAAASQLHVYIDPYTARITGQRTLASSFYGFMVYLHYNLFLGPTGRWLNGWGALLLIVVLVTGLLIWWPGARATAAVWKARLSVRRDAGVPRLLYGLHNVAGVYPFVFSLIFMLTALEFGFPEQVRPFLYAVTRSKPPAFNASPRMGARPPYSMAEAHRTVSSGVEAAGSEPGRAPLSLDALVASADGAAEGRISGIDFPKDAAEPLLVTKALEEYNRTRARIEIAVDPYSGKVLSIHDSRREPLGYALVRWCVPLHYGIWGGLSTKVLYVLLGVVPTVTFVTGFWKWRIKVGRRKRLAIKLKALAATEGS